jgi:hypothetical protein
LSGRQKLCTPLCFARLSPLFTELGGGFAG